LYQNKKKVRVEREKCHLKTMMIRKVDEEVK
jgi:hypothetical protein